MDDLDLIREKINIVDLIAEYFPLKKAGINFKANCPFHQEKTPSFVVSPERQIWRCFGCQKGGDIFKFLTEKEGLEFKDALEILAKKAGVELKRFPKTQQDEKEKLYLINQKAQQFYAYLLWEHQLGKRALDYLRGRGLKDETIKEFGLGYAPNSWEALAKFLKKRGFTAKDLVFAGLCVPSDKGCYDRFRGRIIFPLIDIRERVLGFSGRVLGTGEPKYINTPQTPIFDKGKFFLGLNLSKGEIKSQKEAIITEGEIDMIMSYQSGIKNVVASKGTALTDEQVEVLKKYTDTIILCFDTDLAGDAASRRGIEMADRAGLNIKVVQIEGAKDPAEVCLKNPEAWKRVAGEAIPVYDYYLQSVNRRFNIKSAADKKAIMEELLPIWSKISDKIEREHYLQRLAALLQVKDEAVRDEMVKFSKGFPALIRPRVGTQPGAVSKDEVVTPSRRHLLEDYLVSLILHLPSDHTYVPNFPETLFTQEELRQIYVLLVLFLDKVYFKGQSFKIADFVKDLPAELVPIVDRLYLVDIDEKLMQARAWQKEIEMVINELKKMLVKASLEKLSLQIKSAQEFGRMEVVAGLNRKFRDLAAKLKNL